MDFQVEIDHWRDVNGNSPVTYYFLGLSQKTQARIAKRDDYFEKYTVQDFIKLPDIESTKGTQGYWELKYRGKGEFNYRMIFIIWNKKVIGLELFHGSGSDGRLAKHMPVAIARANDLKTRA